MINKKFDFPVFTVNRESFEEELEDIAYLITEINFISEDLDEIVELLDNSEYRLNMYINNSIKKSKKFDDQQQIILFNKKNEICFYNYDQSFDIIQDYIENNPYSSINEDAMQKALPECEEKYKINKKQKTKCQELLGDYENYLEQYQGLTFELKEYEKQYGMAVDDIKDKLSEVRLLDVTTTKEFMPEFYDEESHELLFIRSEETQIWDLVYLRRDNKLEFMKSLAGQKKKVKKEKQAKKEEE